MLEGRDRSAFVVPSFCDSGSNGFHSDSDSDSCTTTAELSNRNDSETSSAQSDSSDDVECEPRGDGALYADSPCLSLSLDSSNSSDDEEYVKCEARADNDPRANELAAIGGGGGVAANTLSHPLRVTGSLKASVLLSLLVEVGDWFSLTFRCRLSSSRAIIA
ncbi:hypothetical protein MTO96_011455 [Rhipicephalus appendiculatus]